MCQSYKKTCECGRKRAEIIFGNMLLDDSAVAKIFCPHCSQGQPAAQPHQVWDNGWVLELNMAVIKPHAPSFGISPGQVTAEWVFDAGYATWVGITPDDTERRNRERAEIQGLAKKDVLAYVQAMKAWGMGREKRFSDEGWRKMRRRSSLGM